MFVLTERMVESKEMQWYKITHLRRHFTGFLYRKYHRFFGFMEIIGLLQHSPVSKTAVHDNGMMSDIEGIVDVHVPWPE